MKSARSFAFIAAHMAMTLEEHNSCAMYLPYHTGHSVYLPDNKKRVKTRGHVSIGYNVNNGTVVRTIPKKSNRRDRMKARKSLFKSI